MKQKQFFTALIVLLSPLLLSSCKSEKELPDVGGSKVGAVSSILASTIIMDNEEIRPGASLGMYVTLFLAQDTFASVRGALKAVDAQIKLERADESIEKDETFALLEEYGTILQVDLINMLNRSMNREKALNAYLISLEHMNERIQQKIKELEQKYEDLQTERRDQRKTLRVIERDVRDALKDNDFTGVGPKQEMLTEIKTKLATTESRERQMRDILKIYEDFLEIGGERYVAISKNRQVLIAGLHVIEVPGIDDLDLIIKEKSTRFGG